MRNIPTTIPPPYSTADSFKSRVVPRLSLETISASFALASRFTTAVQFPSPSIDLRAINDITNLQWHTSYVRNDALKKTFFALRTEILESYNIHSTLPSLYPSLFHFTAWEDYAADRAQNLGEGKFGPCTSKAKHSSTPAAWNTTVILRYYPSIFNRHLNRPIH